jgi:hypothetical protein
MEWLRPDRLVGRLNEQRMHIPVALLLVFLSASQPQQRSSVPGGPDASTKPQTSEAPADPSDELPVSLKRIQRALAKPPELPILEPKMRNGRPVYRVDVEGAKIDLHALLRKDLLSGPASYGAMTHQEFLDMVTPDDVKGYAPYSNKQGFVVAATSIALNWAVLKAIDQLKKAKDAREREAARKEVEDALEALRKARRAAGLPDK